MPPLDQFSPPAPVDGLAESVIIHPPYPSASFREMVDFILAEEGSPELLDQINPRYKDVLERRHGIGRERQTGRAVRQEFKISDTRLNQLQNKARRALVRSRLQLAIADPTQDETKRAELGFYYHFFERIQETAPPLDVGDYERLIDLLDLRPAPKLQQTA